ncbi:hypothetical protein CCR95_00830 [Thiocystis minor]|uniref:arsenate-mycothiol transferase ArsC n=1 Tax=Thiocystis minor TaxID=61597 RepID=UPI0019145250|nr:hypothetical protein [Thiocystis minor]MBK5962682.1 hypothetical protein [Thiocystis minor]
MNRILFLCTGNYYRSRFAEEYFNHQAVQFALPWEADSRALRRDLAATGNLGPISAFAVSELQRRSIPIRGGERHPIRAQRADFDSAQRIIAVSHREHAPMVRQHFPEVLERIHYFEIGDLDVETPATAIARLTEEIDREIAALRASNDL